MEGRRIEVRIDFSSLDAIEARSVELRNTKVKCMGRKDSRVLVNSVKGVNNAEPVTLHAFDAKLWSSTYYWLY